MTPEYEKYLAHYGIKGQKWGIRRFQNEDGSLTDEGKRRYNVAESDTWKKSESKWLSDDELNRRNTRMQRESQYRQNIDNRHPLKREISGAAKAILFGAAVGVSKGMMSGNYRKWFDAGKAFLKSDKTKKALSMAVSKLKYARRGRWLM